jgi:predicted phage tail protein
MSELIRGAGGGGGKGGGKQYVPKTAPDGLDSTQYAQIIDLLSEGEIEGFKDGLKSIFINDTQLENPDGSLNFKDLSVYVRNGTQDQEIIPLAATVEDERPVGVTVLQDLPVVRTITDPNADAVRVTITVPQLQRFTDKGDLLGTSVQLLIAVQYNGGGFTTVIDDTISGRTGDAYQRDYVIDFTGPKPVDVQVSRVTLDSTDPKLTDAFNWTSYTEIVRARLRYPNSALVGLRVDSRQFSSIPSRKYLIRGIKIQIPSNATVDQDNGRLIYSGIWDGTFGAAQWCSDPAWVLWDLLTSKRYGFGDHIQAAQLDKWAFYSASRYASALVPDGFGGQEPRFSCNVNIQTQEDAFKLINDLCSVFRAMPYWSTGALTISQDAPSDPAYLFTLANVSEEGFSYQSSSQKVRPTVAVVSYLDMTTKEIAYEAVEDQEAIAKYGVVTTQLSAFACTSRGQAARMGEWLLYAEQYEGEVVVFTTSLDAGVIVRPGQIIEIADPLRAGARRGGRISAATTTQVTVDNAQGLTGSGTLSVILPNGTVEARGVSAWSGNVATVAVPFSMAPQPNSVWIYETSNIQASQWRVISVQEQDGSNYAVNALAYNASKYDYIERDRPLQFRDVSDLNELAVAPDNLSAEELLYEQNSRAFSKIVVSWRPVVGVSSYRVRWRYETGNWTVATVERPDFDIIDTAPGLYEIEVSSLNAALLPSPSPAKLIYQAVAKSQPPQDVSGLELVPVDQATAIVSWTRATEIDVLLGGKVLIRHTPLLEEAQWADSQEIVAAAAGSQTQKQVPLLEGTYFLKFEDDTGNRSTTAAMIVVDLPEPQPRLGVQQYTEDQLTPPFPGTATGMEYSSLLDGLTLSVGETTGEYVFSTHYDVGAVFDVNVQRRFVTRSYLPNSLWDDKTDLIDTWPEIDEGNLDATNAKLYVRVTDDDPAGTPTWSPWREFANAIIRGRGFQFKVIARTSEADQNILIDELGALMEMQQRVEQSAVLTSGAGTYAATFANPFYQAPSIGITSTNMATGDYFEIASVTRTGFQVTFRNSAGTAVSRQFTYTAIGFGREIT